MANPSNSYCNPLIQTNALSKSFQKGPSKKTCGKCGHSHSHGDCPAHGTTCGKCGHLNHWAQQCRSSGRRNSSTGRSPSQGHRIDRDASRPSSPESGNLSVRTVYSPTPEMAIIHRTMHDAIHAVREQQGRAVMRSLLNQQKAIAANKLQCNIQIKRTSTPEDPPMSNVPPRRARARSEKANGITSSSSEESDSEPQTSRMARFQALKKQFETPTKSEEESPSHRTFKRQRLFRKTSSQSATDCPSKEYLTPGPS